MIRSRHAVLLAALSVGFSVEVIAVSAKPLVYDLPEETANFRPGPGIQFAEANCSACHSADYISTQPPKRGKAFWEAEAMKMIKFYGAPIAEPDIDKIAEYLAATY